MNKYMMSVTLNSPVCIARKRGAGNVIETLDFIPGSTIRGALAMLYLRQNGTYSESQGRWILSEALEKEFEAIFNSDSTRFGDCSPNGANVIPHTATSCKYYSGFLEFPHDPEDMKTHGVFDTLIPFAEYELIGNKQPSGKMEKELEECQGKVEGSTCGTGMDRFSGYYKYDQRSLDHFEQIKPSKRLIARTALMDSLETAFPGRLYTIEVLNEKQMFTGYLGTDERIARRLKSILGDNALRIGSAKSRALGEVTLRLSLNPSARSARKVDERIKSMNDEMQKYVSQKYPQGNIDAEKFKGQYFFSVTLHSDAILRDEILRFKSMVEIQDLIEFLPNVTPQQQELLGKFQMLRAWLSTNIVSGWNTALKLPKEDELAISKGSVFLFVTKSCKTITDTEIQPLADMLSQIEESGVGERKNEGFGDIRICDEFHWTVHKGE